MTGQRTPGDEWENHYRGYRLHTNPDGEVWWQVYQGTDRLYLDPTPQDLVEQLLDVKRLGGRVRVTEGNDVIAREEVDDEYRDVWVGELSMSGKLVPEDHPEFSVPVRPKGLDAGDLWPSVYDGAKYSFGPGAERVWWQNPDTHKRHPVETPLPDSVTSRLAQYKPSGGSFRVTPWNDVVTLVDAHPAPERVQEQIRDLPRVVKNVLKLRKERGVEKLPVYVGSIDAAPLSVSEPPSLTDSLDAEEQAELESWAGSLGATSATTPDEHSAADPDDAAASASDDGTATSDDYSAVPNDDPADW